MLSITETSSNRFQSNDTPPTRPQTAVPQTPSLIVDIQIPELVKKVLESTFTDPLQHVFLLDDLGPAYATAHTLNKFVFAWNTHHIFLQPVGTSPPICLPMDRDNSARTTQDRQTGETLPDVSSTIIKLKDTSHGMEACKTLAEYRLNDPNRLMSYCVHDQTVASVLPDRGLYDLSGGQHLPYNEGKWMYRTHSQGKEFASYAVMLLLDGKSKAEVSKIASHLADQAEKTVKTDEELLSFLGKEGGSLSPLQTTLKGKTWTEAAERIAALLHQHQRSVLLVTTDRGRLIDAVSIDTQGKLLFTFRDAYVGAQRKIYGNKAAFWQPMDALPPLYDAFRRYQSLPVENTQQNYNTLQQSLFGEKDYLVVMEPRRALSIAHAFSSKRELIHTRF